VQEVISAEIASPPKTRPTPVFGPGHQASTECIPLNISTNAKDMSVRFDWDGLVSSLVHWTRPGCPMDSMPSLGVRAGEPMHESRELTRGIRPDDKMPVGGHGGICEHAKGDSLHGLQHCPFERSVVGFGFEQHGASNRSIENVIDGIGRRSAWTSGHL
jgi:hypothetical protein